jgi:hypothetical protein
VILLSWVIVSFLSLEIIPSILTQLLYSMASSRGINIIVFSFVLYYKWFTKKIRGEKENSESESNF